MWKFKNGSNISKFTQYCDGLKCSSGCSEIFALFLFQAKPSPVEEGIFESVYENLWLNIICIYRRYL